MTLSPNRGSDQSPQIVFSPETNDHAIYRDIGRALHPGRPFIKVYTPPPDYDGEPDAALIARRMVHCHIGPGENISRNDKRQLAAARQHLALPGAPPAALEIEFAAPDRFYPAAEGTPEDYIPSVIRWALDTADTIVLCADWAPGTEWGEVHHRAAPFQATFRCKHELAEVWEGYLRKRLKRRHRLFIVHGAAGAA